MSAVNQRLMTEGHMASLSGTLVSYEFFLFCVCVFFIFVLLCVRMPGGGGTRAFKASFFIRHFFVSFFFLPFISLLIFF